MDHGREELCLGVCEETCVLGWACERQANEPRTSISNLLGAIAECLASAVTNKSMATSDSNLPAVASRSLSAHGRPELCSWCFWRMLVVIQLPVKQDS